jgi:NNMT/PNMT/TEMT family protein
MSTTKGTLMSAPSVAVRWPAMLRWGVTLTATAASTYALDVVATATGLALAGSHLLRGLDQPLVIAFLACTYIAWAAGLRVNLAANARLLERTGTSTNVLSKAAFDIVRRRSASVRAQRFAAGAGYVATELVKEVPYYAGAFALLLTDTMTAKDAIIFLGGANLGAAAYEYGLGRLTRAVLGRDYAAFESDWVPGEYLTDYYSEVEPDEVETIAFFVDAMREVEPGEPVLFFGVGPTLHHVFLAAPHASEIHLADYLPANLREIERWLAREPGAHDWRPFVRYTLQCEGIESPTEAQVTEREELTRARITRLLEVDARQPAPLAERYATVVSAYCADSATADRAVWATFMEHIAGLVRPDGLFVTSALRRCRHYVVGGKRFPSADVDEVDLRAVLAPRFSQATVEARRLAEHAAQGYSGIVLAWAR